MKRRILIVDDSSTVRWWLRSQLGAYDARLALDGQDAIEQAVEFRPELILMDVVMPRLNGLEACRALRVVPGMATVPIILVTSLDDEWSVEQAYRAGCTDFIAKPVDADELHAKVESWLDIAAPAGHA